MGCNSSKKKDTQTERAQQRTRTPAPQPRGSEGAGAGDARPVQMPSRIKEVHADPESLDAMGATPSDSRMQENEDFYQMIVTTYEGDAIDVKSDREPVRNEGDDEEDDNDYEGIEDIPVARGTSHHPRLPVVAEGLDLPELLAAPAAAPPDIQRVKSAVAKLSAACATLKA